MDALASGELRPQPGRAKTRVVKAAAVRRSELIDCAQGLFLTRGYDKTTVNDVIAAAGLSKGAFYHHFRAKEDLLEAIAERISRQSLAAVAPLAEAPGLDALEKLNRMLTAMRAWKSENMAELRALFAALLKPENVVLYHRIAWAGIAAVSPSLVRVIDQGRRDGRFDCLDADLAVEALLAMNEGRRRVVIAAMDAAERGEINQAAAQLGRRLRAEGAMIDRILGLPEGSVDLSGSPETLKAMLEVWREAGKTARDPAV
jgi:AcrR family transcriptional regulator